MFPKPVKRLHSDTHENPILCFQHFTATKCKHRLVIEGSSVASEVCEWFGNLNSWEGQSKDLLVILNARLDARKVDPKKVQGWPKAPRGLTDKLKTIAPNLRAIGIDFQIT